jgi:hypothetical protein
MNTIKVLPKKFFYGRIIVLLLIIKINHHESIKKPTERHSLGKTQKWRTILDR